MNTDQYTARYNEAMKDGATVHSWLGEMRMELREIGHVYLPTGRVVACDAMTMLDPEPFARTVAPGRYPLTLAIAHLDGGADQRVALAILRLTDAAPVTWSMAVAEGQDPGALGEGEEYGYGVDSGTGAFLDLEAARRVEAKGEEFFEEVIAAMETNYVPTRDWAEIVLDAATGLNFVVFSSGLGDGFYASYWGHDERGDVACLVTDFGLLGEDAEATDRPAAA